MALLCTLIFSLLPKSLKADSQGYLLWILPCKKCFVRKGPVLPAVITIDMQRLNRSFEVWWLNCRLLHSNSNEMQWGTNKGALGKLPIAEGWTPHWVCCLAYTVNQSQYLPGTLLFWVCMFHCLVSSFSERLTDWGLAWDLLLFFSCKSRENGSIK